jgi:AcrR family transcriptional regulator
MKETKEHILQTSLHLFMQKGYKEVTMKDIVENTGLSKGAFYHYFDSKEKVFGEVIKRFFGNTLSEDLAVFAGKSLEYFYNALLSRIKTARKNFEQLHVVREHKKSNMNYYYLIFDAMRIIPQFKEQHKSSQENELKTWIDAVRSARENGEISSEMTDEQIAKLFIYTGDGVNVSKISSNDVTKIEKELKFLWDCLYNSIKVKKSAL